MKENVWESEYLDAYDKVLLNSDIYLRVRDFHANSMHGCKKVLDVGSGTGNVTIVLLRNGTTVHAVDPSKKANDILRDKCKKAHKFKDRLNIHIHHTSAEDLSFLEDSMFDGITSMFALYYINNWKGCLEECFRVLRPGGIIALTCRGTIENKQLVLNSYKQSLEERGLVKQLKNEWNVYSNKFLGSVMPSVKVRPKENVIETMKDIGFSDITEHPNPYFGQCYSLTARK